MNLDQGWKSNPLALYYPRPTLVVLLIQMGINQNVDEGRIFASGHGPQAVIVGAAGALLGNALITYPLSRWGYAKSKQMGSRGWAMFAYWATVASLGNFQDYVPVRTFTTEGDMGSIQRGFGCSPWTILVVLGIPTLLAVRCCTSITASTHRVRARLQSCRTRCKTKCRALAPEACSSGFIREETLFPQGLKPKVLHALFGTTEVVP